MAKTPLGQNESLQFLIEAEANERLKIANIATEYNSLTDCLSPFLSCHPLIGGALL
jgi:hypothetical protein